MDTERQKIQLELAFGDEGRGEAPEASSEGTEVSTASRRDESPASSECWMEEVVSGENVKKAHAVFDSLGLPRLDPRYRAQPHRTAVYGPVRTVV